MSGVWPNLDSSDILTRIRTYLNETTALFYTDAELYRYMSIAAKDIAQKSLCVKRIVDAVTANATRTVTTNAYKVMYVEYVPSSGRPLMLTKIDPIKIGNIQLNGTAPQFWYELGSTIGIEPKPDAIYVLRLYVCDMPKIVIESGYTQADWSAGTGWSADINNASHSGSSSGDLTYAGTIADATNYTIIFTISGIGTGGTVTPYFGSTAGIAVTSNGVHAQTGTTNAASFKFTGNNTLTLSDTFLYKEGDISATNTQTELQTAWQNLIVIMSVAMALSRDTKANPSKMLDSLYQSELSYTKQNVSDIIPDGRASVQLR